MTYQKNFLGLPTLSLNLLSAGLFVFLVAAAIRVIKSSDMALRVANTQLITSNSASRLTLLAAQLDEQAELIKQKELARQQLAEIYKQSLKGQEGYDRLKKAIEAVESLPPVEDIEDIQTEISVTGEILEEAAIE